MKQKVLIFGSNGLVGSALSKHFLKEEETLCPSSEACNFKELDQVSELVEAFAPDVIINLAAATNVDACESDPSSAVMVNAFAVAQLAKICALSGRIKLIQVSTDYVFAGKEKRFYKETDEIGPIQEYGMSKWQGENAIITWAESKPFPYQIIRTSWVYGKYRPNFPEAILKNLKDKEAPCTVVEDQYGLPTNADDLAAFIAEMVHMDKVGIFHFSNTGHIISRFEFAKAVASFANQLTKAPYYCPSRVVSCSTDDFPAKPAARPMCTALDTSKVSQFYPIKNWLVSLQDHIEFLYYGGRI